VDAAPTGARREIVLGVTFKIRLSDPSQTPMRLSQQNRPSTSFTPLQKCGRYRINSGQTAPSGLTGSAAFDPSRQFAAVNYRTANGSFDHTPLGCCSAATLNNYRRVRSASLADKSRL
ncbi:MAG: hypothetical protein ABSA68_19690, partial [Xanthobacteraceae bacterium]